MVKVTHSQHRRIPPGAALISINDRTIDDLLELTFYNDLAIRRRIRLHHDGKDQEIILRPNEKMDITVEDPSYRQCENNCQFCFVNGLPSGLRKELYFRDDDYRLSFLFGNFLSLTNMSRSDVNRIDRLRLSPLYVSVHTTDPTTRTSLFQNKNAADILAQLSDLVRRNIKIHTQIVVIPGVTDGALLVSTIKDLAELYPGVASVGVVPVGVSKYLKAVQSLSPDGARAVIATVESFHHRYQQERGYGFVYASDEMYMRARKTIPDTPYYDDFPQIENGIGMVRSFMNDTDRLGRNNNLRGKYLFITGHMAYPHLRHASLVLERSNPVTIDVRSVENALFGASVTVSGLLGARDIKRALATVKKDYDRIYIPPNCVNDKGQFIDCELLRDERVSIAPEHIGEILQCQPS